MYKLCVCLITGAEKYGLYLLAYIPLKNLDFSYKLFSRCVHNLFNPKLTILYKAIFLSCALTHMLLSTIIAITCIYIIIIIIVS